jgi:hypothetical protein
MTDKSDNMTRMYPQALLKQFRNLSEVPNWASIDINAKFDSDVNWYFEVCRTPSVVDIQPRFTFLLFTHTYPNRTLVTLQVNNWIFFESLYMNIIMALASLTPGITTFGVPFNKLIQTVPNF